MHDLYSLDTQLDDWNAVIRSHPRDPKAYLGRGMIYFKLARIEASLADFDRAEKLDPKLSPYLWQRGLSLYYVEDFEGGARQFESGLTVNPVDVEETTWRYLCLARLHGPQFARESLLPVGPDPRPFMHRIYALYAGKQTPADLLAASEGEDCRSQFYTQLYLGLYYEVHDDGDRARHYIVSAIRGYTQREYMWYLACVHQQLRGWTSE
jgi:tetratricopeptide (TPR) repeat protein